MTIANWLQWSRRPAAASEVVTGDAPVRFDGFVDRLSEKLYRQTLGEGGWAVDIGVYGPALFKQDARRVVHEIALSGTVSGPPTP
jgi:hypothetical protein